MPLTRNSSACSNFDLSPQKSGARLRRHAVAACALALIPTPPMAEKPKKPQKLKARLPRGLEDRGPAAIAATRQMVEKIREVYRALRLRAGGDAGDGISPTRSANSCPTRTGPTRACSRSRTTTSSGFRLRYDLTAPLARYVAENFDAACQNPIAATAPAMSIATRSRARDAFASSCSSTPIRWAARRPPPTPRCA